MLLSFELIVMVQYSLMPLLQDTDWSSTALNPDAVKGAMCLANGQEPVSIATIRRYIHVQLCCVELMVA